MSTTSYRTFPMVQSPPSDPASQQKYVSLVDQSLEQDLVQYLTVIKALSPNSIRLIRLKLKALRLFLEENQFELTKQTVEKFIYDKRKIGLNNNSLNSYVFALKQLDGYAKSRNLPYGFSEDLKNFKKIRPMISVLTVDEIEKLLNTRLKYGSYHGKNASILDFKYRTLTRMFATTGCRYTEACTLKVGDVNLSAGRVCFKNTKNGEQRFAFITEPLIGQLKFLMAGLKPDDHIFTSMENKPLHPQSYKEDLYRRSREAGISPNKRVYAHLFRHSFVSEMGKKVKLEDVAKLVGHKDIQTTYSTYYHAGDDYLESQSKKHPMNLQGLSSRDLLQLQRDEFTHAKVRDNRLKHTEQFDGKRLVIISEID